jgi:hypothetical protein
MNARKIVVDGFLIYSFWKISFVVEHAKRKLQQDQQNLRKLKLEGGFKKKEGKFSLLGVCVVRQCITTTTKMVARATSSLPPPNIAIEL